MEICRTQAFCAEKKLTSCRDFSYRTREGIVHAHRHRKAACALQCSVPPKALFLLAPRELQGCSKGGTPQSPCSLREHSLSPLASRGLSISSPARQISMLCVLPGVISEMTAELDIKAVLGSNLLITSAGGHQ